MLNNYETIINNTMEAMDLYNIINLIVRYTARRMCEVLKIEEPTIKISNEFVKTGCYVPECKELHVGRDMCNISTYESFERIMEVICHELRHKWQYDTGFTSLDDPYILPEEDYEAYRNQPVEADAYEFGEFFRSIVAEDILEQLNEKYPARTRRRERARRTR